MNINPTMELQQWLSGWNGFTGDDNSATLSMAPLFALPVQLLGTAGTQRALLFFTYALMFGSAYFALRSWLRDLDLVKAATFAAPLGATVYLVNPWVASESVHLLYLWLYALLPVTFHCVRRSVTSRQVSSAVGWAWLGGLSTIGTVTAYGIAFHGILSLVIVLAHLRRSLRRVLVVWLAYSASAIASSAYWLLPELVGFRQTFQNGTSWALFTTKDMYILSPTSALPYAIRGIYRDWTAALANQVVDHRLVAVAMVAGFALPICASLATLVLGKRIGPTELALLVFGGIALVMANGTEAPLGDLYARIASAPLVNQVAFVLFKGPYKWVPLAVFAMLFVGTATLTALLASARRAVKATGAVTALVVFVWAFVLGSPLLSGDLATYMQPVQPPASLRPSLAQIATLGASEETRAIWLPFSVSGDPISPSWVPSRSHLPLIDGGVPPIASWEAPSPISSRGVSWLAPASGRLRDQLIEHVLLSDPQAELGALMTALGARLMVIRMDVADGPRLDSLVSGHSDVRLAFQDGYFAVFKSTIRQQTVQNFRPAIVIGGMESLAIGDPAIGPGPAERPYVLASDIPAGGEDLFVSNASELWFGPGKTWADLALDNWTGKGRILNTSGFVNETVPLSAWDKDSYTSNLWIPVRLAGLTGSLFEPSNAGSFLIANQPAELALPLSASDANSEVWAHVFVSPLGKSVSGWVSGSAKSTAGTFADTTMGWQWRRLLRLQSRPESQLFVSVTGNLSAIDEVAIVPYGAVAAAVSTLETHSLSADTVSGGYWQSLASPAPQPGHARVLDVPGNGRYFASVRPNASDIIKQIRIDGKTYQLGPISNGWTTSQSIDLSDGPTTIQFDSKDPAAVLLWRRGEGAPVASAQSRSPSTGSLGGASAPSATFQQLNYFENFDPGWAAQTGHSIVHYRTNGFINGYVGSWQVGAPIAYAFSPDDWIARGRLVSVVVLIMSLIGYVLLLMPANARPIFRPGVGRPR